MHKETMAIASNAPNKKGSFQAWREEDAPIKWAEIICCPRKIINIIQWGIVKKESCYVSIQKQVYFQHLAMPIPLRKNLARGGVCPKLCVSLICAERV